MINGKIYYSDAIICQALVPPEDDTKMINLEVKFNDQSVQTFVNVKAFTRDKYKLTIAMEYYDIVIANDRIEEVQKAEWPLYLSLSEQNDFSSSILNRTIWASD